MVTLLCLLAYASAAQEPEKPQRGASAEQVAEWLGTHATPLAGVTVTDDFSDLAPLRDVIGDARVVGFGEAMHNTHEFWSFRNRLSAYLVTQLGFTAIALETGFLDSILADDYIQGENVERDSAARAVFSWSNSVYAENQELLDWLRRYNAAQPAGRRVRLYGLEMLSCGEFDGRALIEAALAFVRQVDPIAAARLTQGLEPLLPSFNEAGHVTANSSQTMLLLGAVHDLATVFEHRQVDWIARTSSLAYQRAYHQVVVAQQLLAYLRVGGEGRDVADAQNLRWVLEREGPKGRVFVFAHNGHLSKRAALTKVARTVRSPMGELLRDSLGDDMVVIGSLFDQGTARELFGLYGPVNTTYSVAASAPDSLNAVFAKARPAPFLVDLRQLSNFTAVDQWFSQPRNVRHVAGYDAYDIRASFDALLFVGNVSPQRLVRASAPSTPGCAARQSPDGESSR